MPLIKRLKRLEFNPPDRRSFRELHKMFPDEGFLLGEKLTLRVEVEGFPAQDGRTGLRTQRSVAVWFLSQASFKLQKTTPIELTPEADDAHLKYSSGDKPLGQLWLYQGWAFSTDDQRGLDAEDVRALVNVEANKRRLALEKAHALQAMTDNYDRPKRRESIAQAVRIEVWQRDGGRCIECDRNEKLEFDHIIPVAMGGGNTSRNLQLLCETCNRRKGASLG